MVARLFIVLVVSGVASACHREGRQTSTTGGVETDTKSVSHVDYRCERDIDCEVACDRQDDCMPEACSCTGAYHRKALDTIRRDNAKKCRGTPEPQRAECPPPTEDYLPRCQEGRCTAQRVPRYDTAKKYTCLSDDDCTMSPYLPNSCCVMHCGATIAYHRDQEKFIIANNHLRCGPDDHLRCETMACTASMPTLRATCRSGLCEATPQDKPQPN